MTKVNKDLSKQTKKDCLESNDNQDMGLKNKKNFNDELEAIASTDKASEELINDNQDNKIAELEEQVKSLKSDYLRALADIENNKKIAQKEISSSYDYAVSGFAKDLIGVIDNFDRALQFVNEDEMQDTSAKQLYEGLIIIKKEFMNILQKNGVKVVESHNCKFDHLYHQAIQEVDAQEGQESGLIVKVYQEGYMIKDRLLRPASVVVTKS